MRDEDKQRLRELSNEQRQAVRAAFKLWVQTARKEGYEPIKNWGNFENEVDHSALLNRLLLGNDPLDQAPPKAFSYPWYQLHETDYADHCEVWIPKHGPRGEKDWGKSWQEDDIVINQSRWKVIEKIDDTEFLVQWKEGYPIYHLRRAEVTDAHSNYSHFGWTMERVDDRS